MNSTPHISIVSPVYQSEELVLKLVTAIHEQVSRITSDYDIILVDDGSKDQSWEEIEKCCVQNSKVKGIKLSRNFGQHYAITAGLQHAKGEWVVVMDCDLQDKPDQIPKLYNKALEGYDLVFARRSTRQDGLLKRWSSTLFYKVFSYLTDTKQDQAVANFGIYNQKVIQGILSMRDQIRYFPSMSQWVGFNSVSVNIEHGKREVGESSYSFGKLLKLAFNNMIAFSDKPLRLTVTFGITMAVLAGLTGLFYLIGYWLGNITVSGFTSIILSLWFLSGVIIFILGMIGLYVGKIFEKVKERPLFLVDKKINIGED